jgi:hypothetical protein
LCSGSTTLAPIPAINERTVIIPAAPQRQTRTLIGVFNTRPVTITGTIRATVRAWAIG